ncbi:MAG: D-alanine--D-alanine ligase [Candidatus Omnitrophota bacterium]
MEKKYGKIGVLMGGPSAERDVSLRSGKAVLEALLNKGYDASAVELDMPTKEKLKTINIDVAFVALHGTFGEDGQIQFMLQEVKIPYTGSGVRASRLGMNKIASRKIFRNLDLPVPDFKVFRNWARNDFCPAAELDPAISEARIQRIVEKFDKPVVVKPSAQGSSVGIAIVDRKEDLRRAIQKAFEFGREVIVEEFIEGKELTVGILGDNALPVIQVAPKRRFYDDVAKYTSGMTDYLVPATISKSVAESAQKAALAAHKALYCRSFSRVDMILDKNGKVVILEVNTIPGMTKLSLLPKAAQAAGIEFSRLCEVMLESAFRTN